ncbi:hypothetical protein LY76DRAFT_409719 [Colletotrichum caudatum]|nr:hypothetical protein LY76DRAFT_409719 [Colletotrichum caudatum]
MALTISRVAHEAGKHCKHKPEHAQQFESGGTFEETWQALAPIYLRDDRHFTEPYRATRRPYSSIPETIRQPFLDLEQPARSQVMQISAPTLTTNSTAIFHATSHPNSDCIPKSTNGSLTPGRLSEPSRSAMCSCMQPGKHSTPGAAALNVLSLKDNRRAWLLHD